MSPGWVAGSVRARHMLARRIGAERARELAAAGSLQGAVSTLEGSAYGRFVRRGMDLAVTQRSVAETALWHVRVLAGWMPPGALELVRALVAWFELANTEDRLAYLSGADMVSPFALGGLATMWPQLAVTHSAAEVRALLSGSQWGDPGADDRRAIGLGLRFSWARRVMASVPEVGGWAAGAVGLLLARELFMVGCPADSLAAHRPPGVGTAWSHASRVDVLRGLLPAQAAWPLAGVESAADVWRGEVAWWRRVERDAERMARDPHMGRPTVIGCLALLAVDARRAGAALATAARGTMEAFEESA
ncbi:MAG: hypothetical protein ACXVSL_20805 [Solirubrobacteraceae bacterium]